MSLHRTLHVVWQFGWRLVVALAAALAALLVATGTAEREPRVIGLIVGAIAYGLAWTWLKAPNRE